MQIKFVIQLVLFICQDGRIYGSPDGVKSIATSVNLFFTRSRLLSYINQFARGWRLMVAAALLLAISISASFAQTAGDYRSAGTGNWKTLSTWERYNGAGWVTPTTEGWPGQLTVTGAVNILAGHTVSILASGISTLPMGALTISGALNLDGDNTAGGIDFSLNTQNIIVTQNLTPTPATILFNQKSNLRLPVNATIYVGASGLTTSNCSNQPSIYIGPTQYYTCAGGGSACAKFEDLMTNGGNQTITLTSGSGTNNQTNCIATPIQKITYAVNGSTGANIAWLPSVPTGLIGNYSIGVYTIEGTPTVSGTFNYTVTTTGPGTCTNATATGTITIAAGTPPTTTGVTICQGGSGSLTSSFTCPVGGTFTSVSKTGIGTNVGGPGTIAWSNPNNITLPVGSPYATANLNTTSTTEYLQGTNYGFSIPADAIISGITVSIKRLSSLNILGVSIYDVDLKLLKNGTVAGNSNASAMGWPMLMDIATYGGTSDLWGTTWTASEINNANFGVSLSVGNPSFFIPRVATVDYMQISVTYTVPPATLDWYTAPYGGTLIGSGPSVNPVGIAGSGLANTNTPGTTTYYAECSTSPGCRTATDFIITPSQPASVSIAAVPSGAICAGTSVKFTATPTNGGVGPTYIWKKGGIPIAGATAASYTSTALANNDKITVEMTSNAACASGNPATSNEITVTVTPTVGIPVFTLGANSSRYQIAETVPYTATATDKTGITYILDATSLAGGNSISPTGAVTYSPTWSGPSTITATATGCYGPSMAIHTVRTDWCFALFAGVGAIHNDLASTVTGDIGTNAGAVDGFSGSPEGTLIGQSHIKDAVTLQAKTDLNVLYAALDAKPINHVITTLDNIQIFEPGVYFLGAAAPLNGELILDGAGNPDAVFIIKIGGALSTAANSIVTVKNGATVNNVFWLIDGAVNIGINSIFQGTFIGTGEINLTSGSKLYGRALTKVGAITLTNCEVSSICAPFTCMSDIVLPTFIAPAGPFEYCVENIISAVYVSNALQINTDPDAYLFKKDDTQFDLDPYKFADNCCVSNALFPLNIRWTIDFISGQSSVSGIGQPSKYGSDIKLWGDGVGFTTLAHTIKWWIKDCSGNESLPITRTITINPRPKIVKAP